MTTNQVRPVFSWNNSAGSQVSKYEVYVKNVKIGTVNNPTGATSSFTPTSDLGPPFASFNTSLDWFVRAYGKDTNQSQKDSLHRTLKIDPTVPNAPTHHGRPGRRDQREDAHLHLGRRRAELLLEGPPGERRRGRPAGPDRRAGAPPSARWRTARTPSRSSRPGPTASSATPRSWASASTRRPPRAAGHHRRPRGQHRRAHAGLLLGGRARRRRSSGPSSAAARPCAAAPRRRSAPP